MYIKKKLLVSLPVKVNKRHVRAQPHAYLEYGAGLGHDGVRGPLAPREHRADGDGDCDVAQDHQDQQAGQ